MADVAAVSVREPDVDHERVEAVVEAPERPAAVGDAEHLEAFLGEAAREQRPQLGVVLDHHDARRDHRHRVWPRSVRAIRAVSRGRASGTVIVNGAPSSRASVSAAKPAIESVTRTS